MSSLLAIGTFVIIRPLKDEEKASAGGILLAGKIAPQVGRGEVVSFQGSSNSPDDAGWTGTYHAMHGLSAVSTACRQASSPLVVRYLLPAVVELGDGLVAVGMDHIIAAERPASAAPQG